VLEKLTEIFSTVHGPVEDNQTVLKLQSIVTFIQPMALCLIRYVRRIYFNGVIIWNFPFS